MLKCYTIWQYFLHSYATWPDDDLQHFNFKTVSFQFAIHNELAEDSFKSMIIQSNPMKSQYFI